MDINYLALLIKDLNQIYQEAKFNQDYPYNVDDLKFLRTYPNLTNLWEVRALMKILEDVNQRMQTDYSFYPTETHHVFDDSYLDYRGSYLVLLTLFKLVKQPLLNFTPPDEPWILSELKKMLKQQVGFLNFHYQGFYLTLQNMPSAEPLLKLLTKTFDELFNQTPTIPALMEFMAVFNHEQSVFINQMIRSKIEIDKLSDFHYDLKKVFYLFKPCLRIYCRWNLINQSSTPLMTKYANSYLN